ncbi:MAG: TonB-dependent receptor [Azoarcus sp.]|jgi:iron complex outermembrane receptor protein|nr:TonB-dependent receptor [Azoarcus sp.]
MKHRPCRIAIAAALACQFTLTSAASSEEAEMPLPPQAEEAVAPQAPAEPQAPVEQVESAEAAPLPDEEIEAPAAGPSGAGKADNVFTLGEITVTGKTENEVSPLAPDTLDSEQLNDFSRDGLRESLDLIPGVSATPGTGSRNEAVISVRGFNRFQVPLLLDGIRLYLPADNRLDLERFLTPDLAEIQVSKGYVSVLNGPDGMGGAINLVTRKPTKPIEGELLYRARFSDNGHFNGYTGYASVGTRQESFYAQAGIEQRDIRGWALSDKFKPTAAENGGQRDHTDSKDWRANLKFGFTPNATDEYTLNFMKQEGEKHGIGSVTGTSTISTWDWPVWDVTNLYWLSHTQLGEKSYIKTKAYYGKYKNELVRYYNVTLADKMDTSHYDDSNYGVQVEVGTDLIAGHTIKASIYYRRDNHTEWSVTHGTPGSVEPKQDNKEDTFSVALEETWHVTPKFDLVFGVSRDARFSHKAEAYGDDDNNNLTPSVLYDQPIADKWATNWQTAAIWRYSDTGKAHFFFSDRTRFPTIFDRFSETWGTGASNPTLKPERAHNFELGIEDRIAPNVVGSAAIFYNEVKDVMRRVRLTSPPYPLAYSGKNQTQNLDKAYYSGIELGISATPTETLEVGANYAYVETTIKNVDDPKAKLDTTPRHQAFLYAKWKPVPKLTIIPALELSDDRWSQDDSNNYMRTGAYELLSLKIAYELLPGWEVSLTGRNLLDKNYATSYGYPQEGRNYLLSTRLKF